MARLSAHAHQRILYVMPRSNRGTFKRGPRKVILEGQAEGETAVARLPAPAQSCTKDENAALSYSAMLELQRMETVRRRRSFHTGKNKMSSQRCPDKGLLQIESDGARDSDGVRDSDRVPDLDGQGDGETAAAQLPVFAQSCTKDASPALSYSAMLKFQRMETVRKRRSFDTGKNMLRASQTCLDKDLLQIESDGVQDSDGVLELDKVPDSVGVPELEVQDDNDTEVVRLPVPGKGCTKNAINPVLPYSAMLELQKIENVRRRRSCQMVRTQIGKNKPRVSQRCPDGVRDMKFEGVFIKKELIPDHESEELIDKVHKFGMVKYWPAKRKKDQSSAESSLHQKSLIMATPNNQVLTTTSSATLPDELLSDAEKKRLKSVEKMKKHLEMVKRRRFIDEKVACGMDRYAAISTSKTAEKYDVDHQTSESHQELPADAVTADEQPVAEKRHSQDSVAINAVIDHPGCVYDDSNIPSHIKDQIQRPLFSESIEGLAVPSSLISPSDIPSDGDVL